MNTIESSHINLSPETMVALEWIRQLREKATGRTVSLEEAAGDVIQNTARILIGSFQGEDKPND